MYDFAELTALFETDIINVKVTMNYAEGQTKSITIPVSTLTWLEYLEALRVFPDPPVPMTGYDEKTKAKAPNRLDPDYLNALQIAAWKRHGYRVVRALEKAGAVFNGDNVSKVAQVMNKSGVFFALHKVVEATTEKVFSKVDALANSFRDESDDQSTDENVPTLEADPIAV